MKKILVGTLVVCVAIAFASFASAKSNTSSSDEAAKIESRSKTVTPAILDNDSQLAQTLDENSTLVAKKLKKKKAEDAANAEKNAENKNPKSKIQNSK